MKETSKIKNATLQLTDDGEYWLIVQSQTKLSGRLNISDMDRRNIGARAFFAWAKENLKEK